jgi:hypothetical protein
MHRSSSKRKQLLRRIAVYSLMTFSVVGLVVLLIFFTLGYRYNQDDGLVQTGLVQFGSKPSGALVTIDGREFGARTPSKTSLEPGSHDIAIQRDGYRQWQKTVDVMGGAVLWLNYARLIPTELRPENTASFSSVTSTAVSPDAKWMLVVEKPDSTTFRLMDLSKETAVDPVALKLPASVYTAAAEGETQRFELEEWDASSRYVIVKHSYGANQEWLVVDTHDVAASQNITKLLDINASRLIFGDNTNAVLFAQIDNTVRRIDRGSATLSKPLIENVAEFSLYGNDTVIFTRHLNDSGKRDVGYYRISEDRAYVVGSYADVQNVPARMAIAEYFGDTYFAISRDGKVTVFRGDIGHPSNEWEKITDIKLPSVQHLSIVTAGRFVIAQAGATYAVYDLELKKTTTTQLRGDGDVAKELRWLDGYNVWTDRGGMLRLYEFDGTNQHNIMKVIPGFNVTLSPDGRYLYGITKTGDAFHLTRVALVL